MTPKQAVPRGIVRPPRNNVTFGGAASQLTFSKQKLWSFGVGETHEWVRGRPDARVALPLPLRHQPPAPHYPRWRSNTHTHTRTHYRSSTCFCSLSERVSARMSHILRVSDAYLHSCCAFPRTRVSVCICVCKRDRPRRESLPFAVQTMINPHRPQAKPAACVCPRREAFAHLRQAWAKLHLISVWSCDRLDQSHTFATFALSVGGCVVPDGPQTAAEFSWHHTHCLLRKRSAAVLNDPVRLLQKN